MDEMAKKVSTGSASASRLISDSLLTAVYRYLCGYGNGLLTDPALHRVVYNLMIKLFRKLISGLVKMGTRVVHANFGRIIICTNKSVPHILIFPRLILLKLQMSLGRIWLLRRNMSLSFSLPFSRKMYSLVSR